MTKGKNLAGLAIAATAAALFISGCESTGGTSARTEQNECKGQGFVKLSAVECSKVTGAGR